MVADVTHSTPDMKAADQGLLDQSAPDALTQDQATMDQAAPDLTLQVPGTWIPIKPGVFQMGSPSSEDCRCSASSCSETKHQVTLSKKYEIQKTEVTQGQFKAVLGYNPSNFSSCGSSCPVEMVNWHMAASYCNALSKIAGLVQCYACSGSGKAASCKETVATQGKGIYSCKGYRLPTEAEWEHAYRAGKTSALYNGNVSKAYCSTCNTKDPNADAIGWYCYNSGNKTHPVGKKLPNAWGLYDMAGNVAEWCHGRYGAFGSTPVTDPPGASAGTNRVVRGGAWYSNSEYLRAAFRLNRSPNMQFYGFGFRCARSLP